MQAPPLALGVLCTKVNTYHTGHENNRMHAHFNQISHISCTEGDTSCIGYILKPTDHLRYRLCIYPYTRIVFLQIFSIKGSRKLFSFQCFQNIGITRKTSINFKWPFPCWRPFAEFRILGSYRQNQFPHRIPLGKSFDFKFLIISLAHSNFV